MTKNFDNDITTFFYNGKKTNFFDNDHDKIFLTMTKKIYFDSKKFFLTMTKTNFFDNDKKGPATKKGFLIQSGGDCK